LRPVATAPVSRSSASSQGQCVRNDVQGVSHSHKPSASRSLAGRRSSQASMAKPNWFMLESTDRLVARPTRTSAKAPTSARRSAAGAGTWLMRCCAAEAKRAEKSFCGARDTTTQSNVRSFVQSTRCLGRVATIFAYQSPRTRDGVRSSCSSAPRRRLNCVVQRRVITRQYA
jgi:hypothetical protein